MKHRINNCMSFIKTVFSSVLPHILFISFMSSISLTIQAEDRFTPPNLSAQANSFNNRFTANAFNVDFLLAHVLNNSRQIERAGSDLQKNTTFINDTINTIDGAISNSVIVPPGTDADTIIILNQNDGDSFAIQR